MNLTIKRKCFNCGNDAVNFGVDKYVRQIALCEECTDALGYEYCDACDDYVPNTVRVLQDYTPVGEDVYGDWCPWCVGRQARRCRKCRRIVNNEILVHGTTYEGDGICLCKDCAFERYETCDRCGIAVLKENVVHEDDWMPGTYCPDCADKIRK